MSLTKITKRAVDGTQPNNADQFLWDPELKGFGLKVTPAGSKVYILQYRKGGRGTPTKRVTIGRHGALTPEQARREAARLLGAVAQGSDPAAARAAQKAAPTMSDFAERFKAEHVDTKTKSSSARKYRWLLDKIILPALGRKLVRDITRADISRLHHDHRGTSYQANHTVAVLSKMFSLAELWGERPPNSNPCKGIERYAEHEHERMLSADELAQLGDALKAFTGSIYVVAAIKLLIFTGARRNEILTLRWEWINFERGAARLPDSKTGAKTLQLPAPALAVLAELPRIEGNPYVIVGQVAGRHLSNLMHSWQAIRKTAGLDDVRLHDLRHAFASVGVASGMGLPIIGKILGHTQVATTARYAHLASDPVKAAAATVATKIADAMQGTTAPAGDIVALRKA
jgi:integrase